MGCESCSSGGGSPKGCGNQGTCATGGCSKLAVFDWLADVELPGQVAPFEYAEVRFKNGRKHFYRNATGLRLSPGDVVIVEGSPGYDVGTVSAAGELARLQMESKNALKHARNLKTIQRMASTAELTLWREVRALEAQTMHKSRTLALALGLEMKISDVEYQGDGSKAIFYYTADGRVDFRELIKRLAEAFRVRIEMKQIGARQEAGRLGGIGSCGRELCCSTWLTDFRSVSTSAARYQQLALNAQKLAGQCGKLKCCLNYELDAYLDALKSFPKHHGKLETKKGLAIHLKTDIFKGLMWYVYEGQHGASPMPLRKEEVEEVVRMNKKGVIPEDLRVYEVEEAAVEPSYGNVVGQDSLTRFDSEKTRKRRKKRGKSAGGPSAKREGGPTPKSGSGNTGGSHSRRRHAGKNRGSQKNRGKNRGDSSENGKK